MKESASAKGKQALLLLAKAVISGSLLFLVFKKASPENIFSIIKTIPIKSFLISVFLTLLAVITATYRWRLFISSAPAVRKLFSFYLIGTFFNTVLPGIVGGDAVKAYYLNRNIDDLSETLASIFFERFLGYVSLIFLCIAAYPFIYRYMEGTAINILFPFAIIVFLAASFIIFRTNLLNRIKFTTRFYSYLERYVTRKKEVVLGLLFSFFIQCLYVLSVFVLARNLNPDIRVIFIFAFFPIITTLSSMPVSISGIGIREASFVILFGAIGWNSDIATALSLSWFMTLLAAGLFGLVEFIRVKKSTPIDIRTLSD
jgi:uncharacterized membrane protein YbhN (UPF0104 family)